VNKIIIFTILILSTLRGYLVLISIPSNLVFSISTIIVIILLLIFSLKNYHNSPIYLNYKKLNKIIFYNSILFLFFIFFELIFLLFGINNTSDLTTASLYYLLLSPFFIYLFNCKTIDLTNILFLISILLCASLLYETKFYFIEGGYNLLVEYRQKFRPKEELGIVGTNFQLAGVVADHHDMANLLGMLTVYFFNKYCSLKKIKYLIVFILLLICLLLTISATNIIITMFILILIMIYYKSIKTITMVLTLLLLASLLSTDVMFVILGFTSKFGNDSNSSALFGFLSLDHILSGLPFFILGHGTGFDTPIIKSEISFIKILFGSGIFHFIILMSIFLYPLYIWKKNSFNKIIAMNSINPTCS
jgi:hypothetical protein